ncbi:FAD binding domain-containing protein [Massilia sp. DWR3-1-1]|uniref:FAD binding domain-containing protein n=1 Tax=Massilia sp. DWR3-1-1 TaxID=2804559 RepID=UPI003CFAB156
MNPITYFAPADVDSAARLAGSGATLIAGGTNLIDLMKERVALPSALADINRLPCADITPTSGGGLMLGALATNADTAYHRLVGERYPLLRAAILAGASPQIRNMASNGGNLLQRTRCHYFYDTGTPCSKRDPGSHCSALLGLTRQHAILGASARCIAVHPSDMCVALAALDAVVHVQSGKGKRRIDFAHFHRLPGDTPHIDTVLEAGEVITHIELPPGERFAAHSAYVKVRDRSSYAFALVSCGAALEFGKNGAIKAARIALGSVAARPWRLREAEQVLEGEQPSAALFGAAADVLLGGAMGHGANDFKIPLARRTVVRALDYASAGTVDNAHAADGQADTREAP